MVPQADGAWREALRGDPAVRTLVTSLSLSEGFAFHIVVCETRRVAVGLLWVFEEEGAAAPSRLVVIRPPSDEGAPGVAGELDVQPMLERLVSPKADASAAGSVVVLDATGAVPSVADHERAWTWLFQRMNERRNTIEARVAAPLVLCIPPWLEAAFVQNAPDFWSIRSGSVHVREPRVPESVSPAAVKSGAAAKTFSGFCPNCGHQNTEVVQCARCGSSVEPRAAKQTPKFKGTMLIASEPEHVRWQRVDAPRLTIPHSATRLTRDLKKSVVFESAPEQAREALLASHLETARALTEKASHADAARSYEQAVNLLRIKCLGAPGDGSARRGLAAALVACGDALRLSNAPERALQCFDEAARSLVELGDSDPAETPSDLYNGSIYLNRAGDLRLELGDTEGALRDHERALTLRRRMVERAPENAEHAYALARNLRRASEHAAQGGEVARSLALREERLAHMRRLVEGFPERAEYQREIAEDLFAVGAMQLTCGSPTKALPALDDSLRFARALISSIPAEDEARKILVNALFVRARVLRIEGQWEQSRRALLEACGEADILVQRDPTDGERVTLRELCLSALRSSNQEGPES